MMSVGEMAQAVASHIAGPESRLFPLYLLSTLALAFVLYRRAKSTLGFFAWLVPRDIYFHKSHLVDIKLFLFGRLLGALGVFNTFVVVVFVAAVTMQLLGAETRLEATWHPVFVGLLVVVAGDFAVYWVHRVHHEAAALWPFHAVHHSAEVMTPITVYRKHPVYDLISGLVRALFVGVLQGVVLALFVGKVDIATIAGVNLFYAAFNALGANLRHSHVWLSYGPRIERILISPAQHQIHHSRDLRHHNKNYGEVFALWDWMFGTLYVPNGREEVTFGLADAEGRPLPQPHRTLREALAAPVVESWRILRKENAPRPEIGAGT